MAKTIITIFEDDGNIEVYSKLFVLAKKYNIKFSTCLIASKIGNDPLFMGWNHVKELQDYGIDINSHGYTNNKRLSECTDAEQIIEFTKTKEILMDHGIKPKHFVYQQGDYNDFTLANVTNYYESAVATKIGIQQNGLLPPFNNTKMSRLGLGSWQDLSTDELKNRIRAAIPEGKWLIFMTHVWSTDPSSPIPPEGNLGAIEEIIKFCQATDEVEIMTYSEAYEYYTNPTNGQGMKFTTKETYDDIHNHIEDLKNNSYDYLDEFQSGSVIKAKFDFNMTDLFPLYKTKGMSSILLYRYIYVCNSDFIDQSRRDNYKRSKFVDKEITQEQIATNPKIFDKNFLLFIDGQLVNGAMLYMNGQGQTYLVFNLKQRWDFIFSPLPNKKCTLLWVDNFNIKSGTINKAYLQSSNNKYPIKSLTSSNNSIIESGLYKTFIQYSNKLEVFNMSEATVQGDNLVFPDLSDFTDSSRRVRLYGIEHQYEEIILPIGEEYFTIKKEDSPISLRNVLLFVKDGAKNWRYVHDDYTIDRFYPNTHKLNIVDKTKEYKLLVFYFEDPNYLRYIDYCDMYYKTHPDKIGEIKSTTVPMYIKDYRPYKFNYNILNFEIDESYRNKLLYKEETLSEAQYYNEEYMRDYFHRTINLDSRILYLDMQKVNLLSKVRYDNRDIPGASYYKFPEPCYLFIFSYNGDKEYGSRKYFIDGKWILTKFRYRDVSNEYLYIPTRLICNDSLLEAESTRHYAYSTSFTTDNRGYVKNTDYFEYNREMQYAKINNEHISLWYNEKMLLKGIDYSIISWDFNNIMGTTNENYRYVYKIGIKVLDADLYEKELIFRIDHESQVSAIIVPNNANTVLGGSFKHVPNMQTGNRNYLIGGYDTYTLSRADALTEKNIDLLSIPFDESINKRELNVSYLYLNNLSSGANGVGVKVTVTYANNSTEVFSNLLEKIDTLIMNDWQEARLRIILNKTNDIKSVLVQLMLTSSAVGRVSYKRIKVEKGHRITEFTNHDNESISNNLLENSNLQTSEVKGFKLPSNVKYREVPSVQGFGVISYNDHARGNVTIESDFYDLEDFNGYINGSCYMCNLEDKPITGKWSCTIRAHLYDKDNNVLNNTDIIGSYHLRDLPNPQFWVRLENESWTAIKINPGTAKVKFVFVLSANGSTNNINIGITGFQLHVGQSLKPYTLSKKEIASGKYNYPLYNESGTHFRVFRNGRKIPDYLNYIRHVRGSDRVDLSTTVKRNVMDECMYEYTPLNLHRVAFMKKIPANGIIDLRGKIKKPFDLKWNEVYLNGIRLNRKMVDILSPTKFQIKDTKVIINGYPDTFTKRNDTISNLEIYERELDCEDRFLLRKDNNSFNEKIYKSVESEYTGKYVYTDKEPDIVGEQWLEEDMEFVYHIVGLQSLFINPNEYQVDEATMELYPMLMPDDEVFIFSPEREFNPPIIAFINANE